MFKLWILQCKHEKITPDIKAGYCPDCGEYIQNHWYISRCKCCGIKQKTLVKNGKIITDTKYCKNCGNNFFNFEKIEKPDIANINYAAILKYSIKTNKKSIIQTWIENNYSTTKLIPTY